MWAVRRGAAGGRGPRMARAVAALALDGKEAAWVARVVGRPKPEVAAALRAAAESGAGVEQRASSVLPVELGGRRLVVKKASAAGLDPAERRDRTRRSLAAELSFYLGAEAVLGPRPPPVPAALGAFAAEDLLGADLAGSAFEQSQAWGRELGVADAELLLVLEDARHLGGGGAGELRQAAATPGGLGLEEARAAVEWLAAFHASAMADGAATDRLGRTRLWEEGAYWGYEKRLDVRTPTAQQRLRTDRTPGNVGKEWRRLCGALADVAPSLAAAEVDVPGLRRPLPFASALAASALGASRRVRPAGSGFATLVHGDFKGANIFTGEGGRATAVDFQWAGLGLGARDLIYFLTTSLAEETLPATEDLIALYHRTLREALGAEAVAEDVLRPQVDACLVDYTRYLVVEMWKGVDPASIEALQGEANVGMHKRSVPHLEHVVRLTKQSLTRMYTEPTAAVGAPGREPVGRDAWVRAHTARRDIAKVLGCCIALAQMGGQLAKGEADAGNLRVSNKDGEGGFDPQTRADILCEMFVIRSLQSLFPELAVVGEEGMDFANEYDMGIAGEEGAIALAVKELEEHHMHDVAPWEVMLPAGLDKVALKDVTVWVDPLDGTQELLAGNVEAVTVLIGISVKDEPLFGVIHQPLSEAKRTVWGGYGLGVWETFGDEAMGQARPVARPPATDQLRTVVTTTSHGSKRIDDAIAKLGPGVQPFRVGGAGNKVLMLLDGKADAWVFPSTGTKRWDTLAGDVLLEAFGGFLAKADSGGRYTYVGDTTLNAEGVVAAVHHRAALGAALGWSE